MEDDLVCEYDSTWDSESEGDDFAENVSRRSSQDKTQKSWGFWSNQYSRNLRAAKDMQNYRRGYPNISEEECQEERMNNLKFYLNEITSSPDEISIEAFHKEWKTDYKRLERVHSYIQWLFPLREPGVNYMASELTKKEIEEFRKSEEAKRRLVESYELMLGFYGIQLLNKDTGDVKRADNWRERFANLERNMHNNLRITRILKSLGELGFEHYQAPLVRFFLEETLVRKTLNTVKRSVLDYFLFAVRDRKERQALIKYAFQHYEPKDKFVWCPRKIQKRLKKKSEKKQEATSNRDGVPTEEMRSKGTAKNAESENVCKEEKPDDSLTEAQKETTEEPGADAGKPPGGLSVDDEAIDSSTADPQQPEEEEMDQSNGTDSSSEKSEVEIKEKESISKPDDTKEMDLGSADIDKSLEDQSKKDKGASEDLSNGSTEEFPNSQPETEVLKSPSKSPKESQDCLPSTDSCRTTRDGMEHISPGPEEGRAEKQPRTDFADLSHEISNGPMPDTVVKIIKDDVNGLQDSVFQESHNGAKWTNGESGHSCVEPMDIESDTSTDMDVNKVNVKAS